MRYRVLKTVYFGDDLQSASNFCTGTTVHALVLSAINSDCSIINHKLFCLSCYSPFTHLS